MLCYTELKIENAMLWIYSIHFAVVIVHLWCLCDGRHGYAWF